MAAPAKVKSGIPGLDEALEYIRLGDNVVWRLSTLDQFSLVAGPFVKQAIADGRNLVYLRFAQHPELVAEQPGVKRYELDPKVGFESFTIAVRNIITREGREHGQLPREPRGRRHRGGPRGLLPLRLCQEVARGLPRGARQRDLQGFGKDELLCTF